MGTNIVNIEHKMIVHRHARFFRQIFRVWNARITLISFLLGHKKWVSTNYKKI